MRRLLLLAAALFVILAIGVPGTALYFALFTQSGLRFVVAHLPRRFGHVGVRIEGVSGTLARGVRVDRVVVDQERVHLEADGLAMRVRLEPLLWQTIRAPEITARRVFVEVKRPTLAPVPHPPQFLPRWLTIVVRHAAIGQAELLVPGGDRLRATDLAGSALIEHTEIHFYRLGMRMGEVAYSAQGNLQAADPLRIAATGRIKFTPRAQPPWVFAAAVNGDLDRLSFVARTLAPFHSEFRGVALDLTRGLHWQARGTVRDFDLRAWHLGGALGVIGGQLSASGRDREFSVRGTLDPAGLRAGAFTAEFDGEYSDHVLTARRIDLTHAGSGAHASASGTIDIVPGGPRIDLRGRWSRLRWPLEGATPPFRSAAGTFEISGTRPWNAEVRGVAQVRGLAPIPAEIAGTLDGDSVSFDRARLELYGGRADVHGRVSWGREPRWSVAGHLAGIDPGTFRPGFKGNLGFDLDASGRGFAAASPLAIAITHLAGRLSGLAASGGGKLTHAGRTWGFDQVRIVLGGARIDLDGKIDGAVNLRFAVAARDLGLLARGARGHLSAAGTIRGTPAAPDVVAQASGGGIRYHGLELAALDAKVDFDPTGRRRSDVRLNLTRLTFHHRLLRSLAFSLEGPASSLTARLDAQAPGLDVAAGATGAFAAGAFTGELSALRITGTAPLKLHLEHPVALVLSRARSQVDSLCLTGTPANLCVSASRSSGGWSATLTASQLPLSTLTAGLTPRVEYGGTIGVTARLGAALGAPAQGFVRVELSDARMSRRLVSGRVETTSIGSGVLMASADAGSIGLSAALRAGEIGTLTANLTARRGPWSLGDMPLTGEVRAETSKLDLLSVYIPAIDRAGGQLRAEAGIAGTVAQPRLRGTLTVENGELDYYQTNLALRQLALTAHLTDDGLDFDGSAHAGKGIVHAAGRLDWRDSQPYGELRIDGTDLEVVNIPEAHIDASPNLTFKVAAHEIDVAGTVLVPYARIAPTEIAGAVRPSSDQVIVGEPSQNPANRFHVRSTITMTLGKDVRIDTMGLTGQLTGSMTVRSGYDAITRATGELSVQNGQYAAYARRLEIQRGRLLFTGGPIDNPGIEIRAVKRYPDVTAGINVRGTLKQPRISFFSDPSLPQSQIVSLILSGGGGNSMQFMQASTAQAQQATAANELLAQGGALLAQQLGSRIGLPDISLETDLNNETSLVLGKYLTPRLYVSYGVGLTQQLNAIKLRYSLGDHWTIRTEAGQIRGADLVFSVEK